MEPHAERQVRQSASGRPALGRGHGRVQLPVGWRRLREPPPARAPIPAGLFSISCRPCPAHLQEWSLGLLWPCLRAPGVPPPSSSPREHSPSIPRCCAHPERPGHSPPPQAGAGMSGTGDPLSRRDAPGRGQACSSGGKMVLALAVHPRPVPGAWHAAEGRWRVAGRLGA